MERSHANFDRRMQKSRADFDRQMKESRADFDARMKKEEEAWILSRKDYDERMKNLQVNLGGMANSHGSFAEEYFLFSAMQHPKNFSV